MGASVSMPCRRRRHNNKVMPLKLEEIRSSATYLLGPGWRSIKISGHDKIRRFVHDEKRLWASCDSGIIPQV